MILIDTHVWVWLLDDPAKLSVKARGTIAEEPNLAVSVVSCWELALLASRQRLFLRQPVADWINRSLADNAMTLLPLSVNAATMAGDFNAMPWEHKDPADRMIVATAIEHKVSLVTIDKEIYDFSGVNTIW